MKELRNKLRKIEQETDWNKIMIEAGLPEVQIKIRGDINRAIESINKALKKNENKSDI